MTHKILTSLLSGPLVLLAVTFAAYGADAQGGTTVSLQPPSQVVDTNSGPFTITFMVQNATNLGSFEFTTTYDPAVVQVTSATLGGFLSSTGRTVFPVGPVIDNTAGTLHMGAASFGSQAGPSGNGLLATITLTPQASGSTGLGFQSMLITDVLGNPISAAAFGSSVTVRPPLQADLNADCIVDAKDMDLLSAHWHSTMGGQNYFATYDLNLDNAINLADVMILTTNWGSVCL